MTIEHDSSVPLYVQIREYLHDKIVSGDFEVDTRLPSERQLAEQFSVSRLTVTKALKELEYEGLIYTQMGKGTYVAPNPKLNQQIETLTSFTEDIRARKKRPASRVLSATIAAADAEAAQQLAIPTGEEVFSLKRLRLANDKIMALEYAQIPHKFCRGILQAHKFEQESLYQVLRDDYGVHLTFAHQTIEARLPTAYEIEVLELEAQVAMLSFTRVTYNADEQPIEFVVSTYPGDRYKLKAMLKPNQM